MQLRTKLIGTMAVLAGLLLTGESNAFSILSLLHLADETSFNYRIDIEVSVDGQIYRGSGVQQLIGKAEIKSLPGIGSGILPSMRGEAVVVDIPGRASLFFTTIGPGYSAVYAGTIQHHCHLNSSDPDPVSRLDTYRHFQGPCDLTAHPPFAVRFADEHDLGTIETVTFGAASGSEGTVLVTSVRIERTAASPTFTLDKRLPWLKPPLKNKGVFSMQLGKQKIYTNTSLFQTGGPNEVFD